MMKPRLFQLIDLDRTLFDTSTFAKLLAEEVNIAHPGIGTELDARFEEAYKKEETFFMLRYLRSEWGDTWFEDVVNRLVEKFGADTFKLAGMRERLEAAEVLSSYQPAWGILTYGDAIDQRMKVRIVDLEDAPLYIADTPDKGQIIHSWQTPTGTFRLPDIFGGGEVDAITFEDDKLRAFKDLPQGVQGLWITNDPQAEQRIEDEGLSGRVVPVNGLVESLSFIRHQLSLKL